MLEGAIIWWPLVLLHPHALQHQLQLSAVVQAVDHYQGSTVLFIFEHKQNIVCVKSLKKGVFA